IKPTSVLAEQYEGMFVQLNHEIRCTNASNLPFACWQGVDNSLLSPTDTILVDMSTLANPLVGNPSVGQVATFLQGIYAQFVTSPPVGRLSYRLQIRDGADIVCPTPPSVIDAFAISADSIRVIFDRELDQP